MAGSVVGEVVNVGGLPFCVEADGVSGLVGKSVVGVSEAVNV